MWITEVGEVWDLSGVWGTRVAARRCEELEKSSRHSPIGTEGHSRPSINLILMYLAHKNQMIL